MRAGLYYGSALIYASARDFAKFGLLYLRDGMWDGQRVLPEGWVDFARTAGKSENADIYGAGWWVTPAEGDGRPYKSRIDTGPQRDAFSAEGFEGQFTLIVPSKDLIIVRLGFTPEKDLRTRRDPRVAGPCRARVPGSGTAQEQRIRRARRPRPVEGFSDSCSSDHRPRLSTLSSTTLPRRSTRSGTSRCASSTVSSRCR